MRSVCDPLVEGNKIKGWRQTQAAIAFFDTLWHVSASNSGAGLGAEKLG